MGLQCHVAGSLVNMLAEALGWSLAAGKEGLSGRPHHKQPARSGFAEGWSISLPSSLAAPEESCSFVVVVVVFEYTLL
jgi:hypothetical protein